VVKGGTHAGWGTRGHMQAVVMDAIILAAEVGLVRPRDCLGTRLPVQQHQLQHSAHNTPVTTVYSHSQNYLSVHNNAISNENEVYKDFHCVIFCQIFCS
jgi:hypothetical protein